MCKSVRVEASRESSATLNTSSSSLLNLPPFSFFRQLPPDLDSDTEGSQRSSQSVPSEKTLLEKLEILTNQGLIQVVKVFVDWLRTNTDIILMCAQVRPQVPWLLLLLPSFFPLLSSWSELDELRLCRVLRACGTDCRCCSTCCQMVARCWRLVRHWQILVLTLRLMSRYQTRATYHFHASN